MNQRRPGFTMIIALATMALVSATIVAIASQSVAQTQAVGYRAETDQLDQLLLASIPSTIQRLTVSSADAVAWTLQLPRELSDATVEMRSVRTSAIEAIVQVQATLRSRKASQTLHLHFDKQWRLSSVALDQ